MDFLDGLNPAQREAVTTITGPVLALAGPGLTIFSTVTAKPEAQVLPPFAGGIESGK